MEKEIQKTNKARFVARDQVNFGDEQYEVSYVNCNSHNVPTKMYRENLLFAMCCERDTVASGKSRSYPITINQ